MGVPLSRHIGNAKEPDEQEFPHDGGSDSMIGDPAGSDSFDVVLGAAGGGMLVEIEPPVEVVCLGWVIAGEEEDI